MIDISDIVVERLTTAIHAVDRKTLGPKHAAEKTTRKSPMRLTLSGLRKTP